MQEVLHCRVARCQRANSPLDLWTGPSPQTLWTVSGMTAIVVSLLLTGGILTGVRQALSWRREARAARSSGSSGRLRRWSVLHNQNVEEGIEEAQESVSGEPAPRDREMNELMTS